MFEKIILVGVLLLSTIGCTEDTKNKNSSYAEGDIVAVWVNTPFIDSISYVVAEVLSQENDLVSIEIIDSFYLTEQQIASKKFKKGAFLSVKASLLEQKSSLATKIHKIKALNNEILAMDISLFLYIGLTEDMQNQDGWVERLKPFAEKLDRIKVTNRDFEGVANYFRKTVEFYSFRNKLIEMERSGVRKEDIKKLAPEYISLMKSTLQAGTAIDAYIGKIKNSDELSNENALSLLLIGMRTGELNHSGRTYEETLTQVECVKDRACSNLYAISYLSHTFPLNLKNINRVFKIANEHGRKARSYYRNFDEFKGLVSTYCGSVKKVIKFLTDSSHSASQRQMLAELKQLHPESNISSSASLCMLE